jgi:hypothetical protein
MRGTRDDSCLSVNAQAAYHGKGKTTAASKETPLRVAAVLGVVRIVVAAGICLGLNFGD